jgi:LmbE family N-acetylglucosaminyl deacetylase/glycosyltransferase involved in cell wall biosynthesis
LEHRLVPYTAAKEIAATSVLVLAPHPDDEALGCGGAILRHVELGVPVRVIVATDGALGLSGLVRDQQVARRERECLDAARILGYGEPAFWRIPDQALTYGEPLVERLLGEIQTADLIYAPSPLEMHPDHRALGMAAVEAVRRTGRSVRLALYEVGIPIRPNLLLDISALAERKQAAVQCFVSQLAIQQYDVQIAALNRYRTYTLPPKITAAEAFLLVSAADWEDDPLKVYQSEHSRQRELGLTLDGRDLPLVSVVVRSIDRPQLADALDSIALQTYPNIEVVVVNARTGNRSLPEMCGRFPMRQVGGDDSYGRSRAANLGLDGAQGEFVIFLDDDDIFLPDHLTRLVEKLQSESSNRAAYAGVRVEDEGRLIDVYDQDFAMVLLLAWNHLPINAVLFERALVKDGCRFDEVLDIYEDWDFWLQVSRKTDFARVPGVSAVYRAHTAVTAEQSPNGVRERLDARQVIWSKWLPVWKNADLAGLVENFRARQAQDERLIADAAFTERELRRMLAEHRELVEDFRARQAQDERLIADAAFTERELRRMLNEHREREAEFNYLVQAQEARITGTNSQIDELNRLLSEKSRVLEETRASTSWRVTAPLRMVSGLLRKLIRR